MLKDHTIIIPLYFPLIYPTDYAKQTAKILAQNNQVVYIHLYKKYRPVSWTDTLLNRKKYHLIQFIRDLLNKKRGNVFFSPTCFFPFQRFPFFYEMNHHPKWTIIQLRIILWLLRKKTIIWGFNPQMNNIVKKLGPNFYIYDCVDYIGRDKNLSFHAKNEIALLPKIDLIVYNSPAQAQKKAKETKLNYIHKSLTTVCGCDYKLFIAKQLNKKTPKPNQVIFAGTFNFRVRIDLLKYIINENRKLTFLLIGPIMPDALKTMRTIIHLPNVAYIDRMTKDKLPSYYQQSRVGIIPYDTKYDFVTYSNPMKTYEYMAAGLPVVSTVIRPLQQYPSSIIRCTDSAKEFSNAIKYFMVNWDINQIKIAQSVAKSNSWENKVDMIESEIIKRYA